MKRLLPGYAEPIAEAFDVLPERMRERLARVEFLTGIDPRWAGLLAPEMWWDEHPLMPGYEVTGACCYPYHTLDRSLTIVLTKVPWDWSAGVAHELGHALHYIYWDDLGDYQAAPVSEYATHDSVEAFAEAFAARYFWYADQEVVAQDRETAALFERLEQ